jgi:ferric-dicitrate binding protein FerR (iron transport regulator)
MSSEEQDGQVDELVARHLDGTLDAPGREQLAAWLRADPKHRREYLRLLELDTVLTARAKEQLTPSARYEAKRVVRRTRRQRPHSSAWAGRFVALAAAVLVVGGALAIFWRPAPPPEAIRFFAQLEGDVAIERAGIRQADEARAWLLPDDVVIAEHQARLLFPDGGSVAMEGGTRVQAIRDAQHQEGIRLELIAGRVACDLPRQAAPFVITSPLAEVTVLGTQFAVSTMAGHDRIAVNRGRVAVAGGGQNVVLAAGDMVDVTVSRMLCATTDNPARLNDSARWKGAGTLPTETRLGGALFAAEKGSARPMDWSGRGWRWYQPLPAASAVALQARFDLPAATEGNTYCEVSWSPPDATVDVDEGQCTPCLRLGIRSGVPAIVRLSAENDQTILWEGEQRAAGPCLLRLELLDGEVAAFLDGTEVWRGPLGFAKAHPGVRMSRRDSGTQATLLERVSLESLLP